MCSGNRARSAIAEALMREHTSERIEAISAGTRPETGHAPPNGVGAA
ncbi:hypothetical protein [Rhodococcus sp. WB9]|nr:hypothetical protein [Rhodococcus sp. WB9]